jgi:pectin methylesterase-like acyl-CoA thioesterase
LPFLRALSLLGWYLLAAPAVAAVLSVPTQFPTLQAAIDAAASGDVIEAAPGVYTQALTVSSKTLEIRSRSRRAATPPTSRPPCSR